MKCQAKGCESEATCAIKTDRPTRANLTTKVWWEESVAPKKGVERLCGWHTQETLVALATVLT